MSSGQDVFEAIIARGIEDRAERMQAIQDAINAGYVPDGRMAERLADYILSEELYDPNPYKVEHNEYPILSETQLNRRRYGRRGSEETNVKGETPLDTTSDTNDDMHERSGVYLASDGRDYRRPIRRTRSISELIFVDEHAKIRNERRRRAYNAFVAGKDTYKYEGREVPIAFIKKAESIR